MLKFHNFIRQNKISAFLAGFLFLGVILFFSSRITLKKDIFQLIPSGEKQVFLKNVLEQTSFTDKIIVTVSATSANTSPDQLTEYGQEFIDLANLKLPEYIENIQGKVPEEGVLEIYDFVYNNLPLFLNQSDYQDIDVRLEQENIRDRLEDNYKNLISPTGLVTKEYLFKDPLSITSLGLQKLEELRAMEHFELYNDFLITKDKKHLVLYITPRFPASEINQNSVLVRELQNIQWRLNKKFDGVKGEFFGELLYAVANAKQINKDIKITMGIAVIILLLLLLFYYRRIYIPLLLFLPGILGGLTALAFLYLLQGSISGISMGIGVILLGINIDYSIHILTHYRENNDLKKLFKDVTRPVLMSSSTTAIAFLCLLFVQSEVLTDLGIFAATSVLLASVFALILIPLLYSRTKDHQKKSSFIDKIAGINFQKKEYLFLFLLLLFTIGLIFFTKVDFNTDLSALNYEPEEIGQTERHVQEIAGGGVNSVNLVSHGNTIDEALEHNNNLYKELIDLKEDGNIRDFNSIGGVVLSTSTQLEKIEEWKSFWTPEKKKLVQNNLIRYSEEYGFMPHSFQQFYQLLSRDFDPIYLNDYRNTTTLYLDDFISSEQDFATVTTSVVVSDINQEEIRERFKNENNIVVIDQHEINQGFLGDIKNDFNKLTGFTALAVFLILLIFYRSLMLSILTFLPLAISWIIVLGLMAVINLEFNIVNIIVATLIFGLSLDYSIFITNAFLKEYETGVRVLRTYRTSIVLSVITTLLAIGSLFFAEHPALRSISVVSIIGVFLSALVTFVIQGFLFDSFFIQKLKSGKPAFSVGAIFRFSKRRSKKEKLYFKEAVLDNYRYKSVFPEVKKVFEKEKERFFKVSEFLEDNDKVLHFNSQWGMLPIYLSYKNPKIYITSTEPDPVHLQIAQNCPASHSEKLEFIPIIPSETDNFNVFIISTVPQADLKKSLEDLIARQAQKVIILTPEYSSRWLVDLDFEISYRQNQVLVLQKQD